MSHSNVSNALQMTIFPHLTHLWFVSWQMLQKACLINLSVKIIPNKVQWLYRCAPVFAGNTFQDLPWWRETMDNKIVNLHSAIQGGCTTVCTHTNTQARALLSDTNFWPDTQERLNSKCKCHSGVAEYSSFLGSYVSGMWFPIFSWHSDPSKHGDYSVSDMASPPTKSESLS
jgi:hypothetical protein